MDKLEKENAELRESNDGLLGQLNSELQLMAYHEIKDLITIKPKGK